MSKIVENANIVTIIDNKMVNGTVLRVHEELDLAIVQMEDGSVHKVKRDLLSILEKEKPVDEEPKEESKEEPKEGVKVITKEELKKVVETITDPVYLATKTKKDIGEVILPSMTVMIVGMRIADELFNDKDEIEISREKLKVEIITLCSPSSISESVMGEMSPSQVAPIALLSALILTDIPDILFGESENE